MCSGSCLLYAALKQSIVSARLPSLDRLLRRSSVKGLSKDKLSHATLQTHSLCLLPSVIGLKGVKEKGLISHGVSGRVLAVVSISSVRQQFHRRKNRFCFGSVCFRLILVFKILNENN